MSITPVNERFSFPPPNPGPHAEYLSELVRTIIQTVSEFGFRINRGAPPEYTVATLPTASDFPGSVVYVSDGAAGAKFRGSDGTSWVNLG